MRRTIVQRGTRGRKSGPRCELMHRMSGATDAHDRVTPSCRFSLSERTLYAVFWRLASRHPLPKQVGGRTTVSPQTFNSEARKAACEWPRGAIVSVLTTIQYAWSFRKALKHTHCTAEMARFRVDAVDRFLNNLFSLQVVDDHVSREGDPAPTEPTHLAFVCRRHSALCASVTDR